MCGVNQEASDGRDLGAQGAAASGLAQEAQRRDGRRIRSEGLGLFLRPGQAWNEWTDINGQNCSSHQRTGHELTVAYSLYYRPGA